ncbi:MAG: hypothetical protein IT238_03615 [Bacteroidia bacterium]|nr:hypothetical protein [Bacteroidia bacterium]
MVSFTFAVSASTPCNDKDKDKKGAKKECSSKEAKACCSHAKNKKDCAPGEKAEKSSSDSHKASTDKAKETSSK